MAHLLAGEQAGQELVVCLQRHQGPQTCTRIPTEHSTVDLNTTSPQPQSHFTLPHVLATAASLLPINHCLPLRQQRPRRTGSVTHRISSSSIWSCRALPPPPTYIDSDRARCHPDSCLTNIAFVAPKSVSLFFLLRLSAATKQPRHSSLRPQLY